MSLSDAAAMPATSFPAFALRAAMPSMARIPLPVSCLAGLAAGAASALAS